MLVVNENFNDCASVSWYFSDAQVLLEGVSLSVRVSSFHKAVFIAQASPCRPFLVIIDIICITCQHTGGMFKLVVGLHVYADKILRVMAVVIAIDIFGTHLQLMSLAQRTEPVSLEGVFRKTLTLSLQTTCVIDLCVGASGRACKRV